VVSDSEALEFIHYSYNIVDTYEDAVVLAANAGIGKEKGRGGGIGGGREGREGEMER
jgi:hypothetical protein